MAVSTFFCLQSIKWSGKSILFFAARSSLVQEETFWSPVDDALTSLTCSFPLSKLSLRKLSSIVWQKRGSYFHILGKNDKKGATFLKCILSYTKPKISALNTFLNSGYISVSFFIHFCMYSMYSVPIFFFIISAKCQHNFPEFFPCWSFFRFLHNCSFLPLETFRCFFSV